MNDEQSPAVRVEPTDVRYGTRSLLATMTFVAVVVTALGVFFRQFPAETQPRLVAHWCIFFVALVAAVGYIAWRRYQVEREAGQVRYVLATHSYFAPRLPIVGRTLLGIFMLFSGLLMWGTESYLIATGARPFWMHLLSWGTYASIGISTGGIAYLWWYRYVRVCDGGLVVRHQLVAWGRCSRWYWDAVYPDVIVIDAQPRVALKVPQAERAALEAFVSGRTLRVSGKEPRTNP